MGACVWTTLVVTTFDVVTDITFIEDGWSIVFVAIANGDQAGFKCRTFPRNSHHTSNNMPKTKVAYDKSRLFIIKLRTDAKIVHQTEIEWH